VSLPLPPTPTSIRFEHKSIEQVFYGHLRGGRFLPASASHRFRLVFG
jgi:hypothetical protein